MKKIIVLSHSMHPDQFHYLGGMITTSIVFGSHIADYGITGSEGLGVRNPMLEKTMEQMKEECLNELIKKAQKAHCDTLYDVHYEWSPFYSGVKTMMMVHAYASIGIRKFESSTLLGNDVYIYEKCLMESQKRFNEILRDYEYNHDMHPFLQFVSECKETNVCDDLCKDVFHMMMSLLEEGFPTIFEEYLDLCSQENIEVIFFAHMHATRGEQLLELRRKIGFKPLIQYLSRRISLTRIYSELKRKDDYLDIVVLHPLLAGYTYLYHQEDQLIIPKIIQILKQSYYHESIDVKILSKEDKVCRCGRILLNGSNCTCGARTKINISSYIYKQNVLEHLENVQNYLGKQL